MSEDETEVEYEARIAERIESYSPTKPVSELHPLELIRIRNRVNGINKYSLKN